MKHFSTCNVKHKACRSFKDGKRRGRGCSYMFVWRIVKSDINIHDAKCSALNAVWDNSMFRVSLHISDSSLDNISSQCWTRQRSSSVHNYTKAFSELLITSMNVSMAERLHHIRHHCNRFRNRVNKLLTLPTCWQFFFSKTVLRAAEIAKFY